MKLPTIPTPDSQAAAAARARQATLTKPPGSLGRLEELSIQLAAAVGNPHPATARKAVIIMAADHGVAAEGVSAYPAAVTRQMAFNFVRGGAAINVLARQAGARVVVVDIGIATDFGAEPGILSRKIAPGTHNIAHGPAMSRVQAETAINEGIDVVQAEIANGLDLVATGDMGIGNTTAAAAITAVITRQPVASVTGRGTGIDNAGLAHKVEIIERALAINKPNADDPLNMLSKVGGLEIAGLAGVMIGAAAKRVPVVIDGFISGAAALIAVGLAPDVRPYLIAAHQSTEAGHRAALDHLDLRPLLDLNLRLGEGTGAVLAFHLVDAAARILNEMATFAEAGVENKTKDE